jgi:succinate dehydrogenase / fumarate reductase, membrane anchor subunit|tara:strand:+ start:2053 stop:2427 length:375 start_codon:yes stop_codon:yes gene_type:complete
MGVITNITSFSRNGLSDWLLQRVTAVIITVYICFLTFYFLTQPNLDYAQWRDLNGLLSMKVLNVLTVISIAIHSWIGLWGVLTDYITVRLLGPKATFLRVLLQVNMIIVTLIYLIWALDIVWGI